jgi:hypothetical protein
MRKLIYVTILALSCGSAFAHSTEVEFESEQQEVEAMLRADLQQNLEAASLLSNTILSPQVETDKKCEYLNELKLVQFNLDLTIRDFERIAIGSMGFSGSADIAFDEEVMHKKMYAENYRSQWINYNASIQVFEKNLDCQ